VGIAGTMSNVLQRGASSNNIPNSTSTVTSVTPTSVVSTVATLLQVNGSGFKAGTTIHVGATAVPTTFVSPSRVDTTAPGYTAAAPGTLQVTVQNAGEDPSNSVPLTAT